MKNIFIAVVASILAACGADQPQSESAAAPQPVAEPAQQDTKQDTKQIPATADANSQSTGRPWVSGMSAVELLTKVQQEPKWLMQHLIDDEGLMQATDAEKWCIHQAHADGCEDYLLENAPTLLDFVMDDDRVVAIVLPGVENPTADQLLDGLESAWPEQFAGGFAKRIGRVVAASQPMENSREAGRQALLEQMKRRQQGQ